MNRNGAHSAGTLSRCQTKTPARVRPDRGVEANVTGCKPPRPSFQADCSGRVNWRREGAKQSQSPPYVACRRRKPIAVGKQIISRPLDLIGRQQGFGSRGRHVVHCGKGSVGRTAGQQAGGGSRNKTPSYDASKAPTNRHVFPPVQANVDCQRRGFRLSNKRWQQICEIEAKSGAQLATIGIELTMTTPKIES
jgi:hypothetical protein